MNRLKNRKGFTLIELLIVMAVMALIATIAFPFLSGIQEAFRFKADNITAETLAKQVQLQIVAGRLSTNPMDDITTTDLGQAFPDTKLDDGQWVVSHDGITIYVLYDRNSDGLKDDEEPYAEREVLQPIE